MKIALVITAKNEARLLRRNLRYHKAIGLDRAFVYFDHTTDNGQETLKDLDFVYLQNSVEAGRYDNIPFLKQFTSKLNVDHTARQCLNTYDAIVQSKSLGYDWLISLDADELVCTDFDNPSDLKMFFSSIDSSVDVVNFRVYEVLQRRLSYNNVFKEETTFKTTYNYSRKGERIYKTIYNPFEKRNKKFLYWYGQTLGKGAIRIENDIIPSCPHTYKKLNGNLLNIINKPSILHFYAYDFDDFKKKYNNFKNRPDKYLSGHRVQDLKLLLRDVVNKSGLDDEHLKKYYRNNVMFCEPEVKRLKRNRYMMFFRRYQKSLKTIVSAQKVFNAIS